MVRSFWGSYLEEMLKQPRFFREEFYTCTHVHTTIQHTHTHTYTHLNLQHKMQSSSSAESSTAKIVDRVQITWTPREARLQTSVHNANLSLPDFFTPESMLLLFTANDRLVSNYAHLTDAVTPQSYVSPATSAIVQFQPLFAEFGVPRMWASLRIHAHADQAVPNAPGMFTRTFCLTSQPVQQWSQLARAAQGSAFPDWWDMDSVASKQRQLLFEPVWITLTFRSPHDVDLEIQCSPQSTRFGTTGSDECWVDWRARLSSTMQRMLDQAIMRCLQVMTRQMCALVETFSPANGAAQPRGDV